ncbi:baseplate J/gp47 family protein, partial [Kitasatospora sp. NPDC091257]
LTQADVLLAVLSNPVPDTRVSVQVQVGTAPSAVTNSSSWAWEAWAGTRWVVCGVVEDTTGGFQQSGYVTLQVPSAHSPTAVELNLGTDEAPQVWRAEDVGLLRCTYTGDQYFTMVLTALTLEGQMSVLVPVVQAEVVDEALVGVSTGLANQRFALPSVPLLTEGRITAETTVAGQVVQEWQYVRTLSSSGPDDQNFWIDPTTGEAVFGIEAKEVDGPRRHGAIPPKGAEIRITRFLTGGGSVGNVPARSITALRNPLPPISAVSNPSAAVGGTDAESVEQCAHRLPLGPLGPQRAVTAADIERLVLASPTGVLRAKHVGAGTGELLTPFTETASWTPATAVVTISNNTGGEVSVPAGTVVGTVPAVAKLDDGTERPRATTDPAVKFTTIAPATIPPSAATGDWTKAGKARVNVIQEITLSAGTAIDGQSTGTSGMEFYLPEKAVFGQKPAITVTSAGEEQLWTVVDTFTSSGPADQHVMINASDGAIIFGFGGYGAIPLAGSTFTLGESYQATLGSQGNVTVGQICAFYPPRPEGTDLMVTNELPATGGADGTTVPTQPTGPYGLMVIPALAAGSRINYTDLLPSTQLKGAVTRALCPVMPPGVTVAVQAAGYQGIEVVAVLAPEESLLPSELATLGHSAEEALYAYFNPLTGGPDGTGWPFGRPVHVGDAYVVLARLPEVAEVKDIQLYPANPITGERGAQTDRVEVTDLSTVFSVNHTVTVEEPTAMAR